MYAWFCVSHLKNYISGRNIFTPVDKLKNSEDASKIIGDAIKIERVLKIVLTSQVDQLVSFGDVICYLKVIG